MAKHRGENESYSFILSCESPRHLKIIKEKKPNKPVQRGENESIKLQTTLCILPDILNQPQYPIKQKYKQRGEREYNLKLHPVYSPRHEFQKQHTQKNINNQRGETTTHIIILLPMLLKQRCHITLRPYYIT